MQERQHVGPNCLCNESHVPAIRGTNTKALSLMFSRQCLLHRYSNNLCPQARDVRQGFAPLWKVLNARLRSDCKDTDDIVPPIDVLSPTLTVADKNPTVLLVY